MIFLTDFQADSSWKYTFLIMMILILIGCGFYTYFKIIKDKNKMRK